MQSPTPTRAAHHAVLDELIALGTDIARQVHAQATRDSNAAAKDPAAPRHDHTIAFDRIARTVRRTILLAQRLDAAPAHPIRTMARRHIIRDVENAITRSKQDPGPLRAELHDRLDGPELIDAMDDDIAHRPIPDIIAELCRDLGVASQIGPHPWPRRTPTDVRALCTQAAHQPTLTRPVPLGSHPPPSHHPRAHDPGPPKGSS